MVNHEEARRIVASYPPPYGQAQLAMRRAYGVTTTVRPKRRRARPRKRSRYAPSIEEVGECMRQRHGVDVGM